MKGNLNFLGLARKAGRLAVGEDPCGDEVKAGNARLILTARDAGVNTKKRAKTYSDISRAPHAQLDCTKAELGAVFGRASCAICAVCDVGFARAVWEKMGLDEALKEIEAHHAHRKPRRAARRQEPASQEGDESL